MKRTVLAGVAGGLLLVLAGCSRGGTGERPAPTTSPKVPVMLAALTSKEANSNDAFSVSEVGPSGTVPHENLEGGVWVLFNKPVIALKTLDKPATTSSLLTISPAVDGIYRWYGSRLYAFEPKGQLAPATEYTFTVSPTLKSLQGETLTGDTRFTFRTEPLSIVALSPSGDDVIPEASGQILVTFNFPVDMKTILPFIRLEAGGKTAAFKAARPAITDREQLGPYENADRMVLLTPSAVLPRDADVTVRVLAGAKPRPENYGTDAEISRGFHTLRPLSIEETYSNVGRAGVQAEIRFNHALNEETVASNLKTSVTGYSLANKVAVSGSWVNLQDIPADFESSFSVQVLAGITDLYAQKLGQDQTETFEVGPAEAYVNFRNTGQKILESQFPPRVAVEMQNVDSGTWTVGGLSNPYAGLTGGRRGSLNVRQVPRNRRHFELFDLRPFLNDAGKGTAYLSWDFKGPFYGSDEPEELKDDLVVQVTDIGASLNVGFNSIVVVANSLATGAPLPHAAVALRKDGKAVGSATTDARGLASIALPAGLLARTFEDQEERAEIEIASGKDRLVLRPSEMEGRTWNANEPYSAEKPVPLTYVWSDRGIYRPGETISFAGIDRDLVLGKFGPVPGTFRLDLTNGSEDAEPAASVTGKVSASGSFSGQVVLPKTAVPGDWLLTFHRAGGRSETRTGTAYVQVANFRRVAFSVGVQLSQERAFMGDTLQAKLSGSYLSGGTIMRGKWSWFWSRRETWYQPPGDAWASYTFGDVEKGWSEDLNSDSGSLSGTGEVTAPQKLGDGDKGRVYDYQISGTIEDVDRQAISSSRAAVVFASEQMLGAKLTSDARSEDSLYFVTKAQPFTLKVVSVDPDGAPYKSGPVQGRLLREEWKLVRELTVGQTVDTHYEKDVVEEKTFTVTPARPFAAVNLSTQKAGSYAIELSGKDSRGRESFTRISFYSTGSDAIYWQRSDERQIEIVPDKKIYAPGDTAKLLIKTPLARGTYLVSVERDGVLEQRTVDLVGSASTISVPITEAHVPIVYVYVATATGRTQPPADGPDAPDFGKPRGYSGLLEIPVQTASRTITLSLTSAKASYLPGTDATVTLKAMRNGQPVAGAEISLVAADRGVLDLINYHVPSPIDFFYNRGNFPDKVAHFDSRDLLMDPVTWKANDLPGGDEKGESAPAGPGVGVRRDFNPTAVFRTGLVTGRDGTVSVHFKLPDLLTTFRSTAVAVKDDAFGIAEGEILVQNPLNVRTALPRRMRVGDAATAGVVVTNIDARTHAVSVTLSAQGVQVKGAAKKTITLKAGDTAEVAFDLAAPTAGTAKFVFSVDSDILRERLEDSLAVTDPHLTESVTIVGKTTDLAKEALVVPSTFLGVPEEGLYLSMDSTIASSLAGAVHFLDVYPYDCLEQVTSKLFARVLFPMLAGAGSPDLSTVERFANEDGGFSYWDDPAPRRSNYYVTLRVAHLVAAAKERNIPIPDDINQEAMVQYLDSRWENLRSTYLQAYALYVLTQYGQDESERADSLAEQGDDIGVFGYGFVGLAYDAMGNKRAAQSVLTRLKNFVRVGTRTVTLVGTVNDWLWYGGDLQAKALLLMLYARVAPDSQLVLGLANDLLASNSTGHWQNTSNAGWVLQAFSELVKNGNETNANFTATAKLGTTELAKNQFRGFSRKPYLKQVTAADLSAAVAQQRARSGPSGTLLPLTLGLQGTGTLYYTAELRTATLASAAEPRDEGIGIATEILDDTGSVVSGTDLGLGKVYTMRVVFYSSKDRNYLAIRAPIPSGAEPIDGSLLTSQVVQPPASPADNGDSENGDQGYTGDYGEFGYTTHIYDDEVRFYFDQLARGKHEVTFLFRTTTPGVFPTPPTAAECMYQPEVFGRTGGVTYRIVDK